MRNPALTSPDGPGNLLAAVRVAADPWVRAHAQGAGRDRGDARRGLCGGRRAEGPSDAAQRLRLDRRPDRWPLWWRTAWCRSSLPVRDADDRRAPRSLHSVGGKAAPVALFWMALDERCAFMPLMLAASDRLGYRGAVIAAMGGGHAPERAAENVIRLAKAMPTVVSPRAGGRADAAQDLRRARARRSRLREAGLIWGGRLHPLKGAGAAARPACAPGLERASDRRSCSTRSAEANNLQFQRPRRPERPRPSQQGVG